MSVAKEEMQFENIVERLEEIAAKLESGDATLEDSLALYEEGVRLSRLGTQRLDAAEKQIELLTGDGEVVDFDDPSGEA